MKLPSRLAFHGAEYMLDGGSMVLRGTDPAGRDHSIELHERMSLRGDSGRLFFDGQLIDLRSPEERAVLELLRRATLHGSKVPPPALGPNIGILGEDIREVMCRSEYENQRVFVDEIVRFVESDLSLQFAEIVRQAIRDAAERASQANHPGLFTVRVAAEPERRQRVIVGLARALRLSVKDARERVDNDRVIETRVPAVRVVSFADLCAAEGVAVEVQPEFPWPLPDVPRHGEPATP
jgi:hypothetical protein